MRNVLDPAIDPALRWLGHDDASIDAHQKKEKIKSISRLPGGGISAIVPGKTDFFRDPACVKVPVCNSPFFAMDVSGDFIARMRVKPTFSSTYVAGGIMVYQDDDNWAKLCFEKTGFGTNAAVSIVTRDGFSDDANGANVEANELWLRMARQGDTFILHYALPTAPDVRMFRLPLGIRRGGGNGEKVQPRLVKVGLTFQCPNGDEATIDVPFFSIDEGEIDNIRNIV